MKLSNIKLNLKIFIPLFLVILLVIIYFVYNSLFANKSDTISDTTNIYLNNTELGKNVDILNKENISFDTNIDSTRFSNLKDFSLTVNPSKSSGRSNPFLP